MTIKGFFKCALIVSIFMIITSCGGGGGGGDTDTATDTDTSGGADTTTDTDTGTINVGEQITVTGTLDELTLLTSKPEDTGWFKSALRYIFPSMVNAQDTPATINRIIAIGQNRNVVTAARNQSQFSLNLDRNNNYLMVFLNGAEVEAVLQVDEETDLDVLPPSSSATDIDLGTISLNSQTRRSHGTIGQSALFSGLGRSSRTISAIGVNDQGFLRYSSLDVDRNGVLDFEESKDFFFGIAYEFDAGTFPSIIENWSNKDGILANGYFLYLMIPESLDLDWQSAVLQYPAPIDGESNREVGFVGEPEPESGETRVSLIWDAGSTLTPPKGDYILTIGSNTFTFNDVESVTIDDNLSNVYYIPAVRLTRDGNGMVTLIEWEWWKKTDGTWEEVTTEELETVLGSLVDYQFVSGTQPGDVHGRIPLTSSGSKVPETQSFTPTLFSIVYGDKAEYNYGFKWSD